jgi:protein TonB
VRCDECESDPLSTARYCECCGRELSLHQTQANEIPVVDVRAAEPLHANEHAEKAEAGSGLYDWAPNPNAAAELRCPSCDGPSLDANLCQACQQPSSIEGSNPGRSDPATPSSNGATASAMAPTVEETVSSAATTATPPSQIPSESATLAKVQTPHSLPEATTTLVKENVSVARPKAVETTAARSQEALPKRAQTDTIHAEKVRRPADINRRTNIPVTPPHRDRPIALAAVAVVLAAIAVSVYWVHIDKSSVIARVEQLVMFVSKDSATKVAEAVEPTVPEETPAIPIASTQVGNSALTKERPVAQTTAPQDRTSTTTTSSKAAAPIQPKPVTAARPPRRAAVPAVANKPVRVQASTREVPAVPVLTAARAIAPPVVDVVATAPAPAAPPPAAGPFFETRDVNETPRVEKRAEPRLPDELRGRSINEVVVVRALVSQNGHPSRISLLRRTKTGPQLDDVVVEAVNHWTFSPAKKKGEAVSCWFNFAVQVGRAN